MAQQFKDGADFCSQTKSHQDYLPQLNEFDSPNTPVHSFNVLNYELKLDIYNCFISPYPRSYSASNKMRFRIDSVLNQVKLNAVNTSLSIDSIKLNTMSLTYTHASDILTINMDRTYNPGEVAEIIIYFRHSTVSDNAFYVYNGMVFTDCPPEGARKWFP